MPEEKFSRDEARLAYESFPPDLPVEAWREYLDTLVHAVDNLAAGNIAINNPQLKIAWTETAAMRKARDVVLYTLTDPRLPALFAALVQAQPLLDAMRAQAQRNIESGTNPEDSFRANKWLGDLRRAMEAMQQ